MSGRRGGDTLAAVKGGRREEGSLRSSRRMLKEIMKEENIAAS